MTISVKIENTDTRSGQPERVCVRVEYRDPTTGQWIPSPSEREWKLGPGDNVDNIHVWKHRRIIVEEINAIDPL